MSDIIIYGRGKTGQSLMKMLQRLGKNATFYDDAIGFEGEEDFTTNSIVLLSPGVMPSAKGLKIARQRGAKIISELEYCFPFCKGRCISVTGTNGKTTTCEMIYHILHKCNFASRLLGNGGVPISTQVLDVSQDELIVLESSSFQLLDCNTFAPYVSVFTNLAVDHINHHGSFEEYAKAKENNFVHQRQGYALFNLDDNNVVEMSQKCKCKRLYYSVHDKHANCYYDGERVVVQDGVCKTEVAAAHFAEYAKHNLSNALGAVLACCCVGVSLENAVSALQSYQLLPHRLQHIATYEGVTFVDDSKATNVHATVSAMQCFSQNLALILGGSDKGEQYDNIFTQMKPNVKLVVAVGQSAHDMQLCAQKYGIKVLILDDFKHAVKYCYEQMRPIGGVVLMSNACASFDSFGGYEERGEYFVKVVKEIQSDTQTN